jgi:DNA-binding CsgD family transcriptional regulator
MPETVVGTIEAIYEAAASPAGWPDALTAVGAVTGASAGILLFGSGAGELSPLATLGLDAQEATITTGGVAAMLFAALAGEVVGALIAKKPTSIAAGNDGQDPFAGLGGAHRYGEAVGVCLLRDQGATAALWLFRRRGACFEPSALDDLHTLVPHLSRAVALQARVERAEKRAAEAGDAFDRVALGVVLVDGEAKPILANRAAKRIAGQQDGFTIAADGLRGATPGDTRMLQGAIAGVAGEGSAAGLGLRLSRLSSSRPYEVVVVPISRARRWPARRRRTAVVFISDAGPALVSPAQLVHDLYGLSEAETRLALLLLSGQGMREAAATLGVSRNTAHSQLASIFRKTETSSQAELVAVLLRGPFAVRLPGGSSDAYPPVEGER